MDIDRAEQFFTACTQLPYPEEREDRSEDSLPELQRLAGKLDDGQSLDAIEYGRGLMRHYPDFDVIPTIIGTLLIRQSRAAEVRDLLRVALPQCHRRYQLYSMAGQADLALSQLANACVWWSRSTIAQVTIVDYQVYSPFYHLAHVALVLGARNEAEAFFAMSSAIEPRGPHLSPSLEERLEPLRHQWVAEPLIRVLNHVEVNHLRSGI